MRECWEDGGGDGDAEDCEGELIETLCEVEGCDGVGFHGILDGCAEDSGGSIRVFNGVGH